jgi:hypothetical protein
MNPAPSRTAHFAKRLTSRDARRVSRDNFGNRLPNGSPQGVPNNFIQRSILHGFMPSSLMFAATELHCRSMASPMFGSGI